METNSLNVFAHNNVTAKIDKFRLHGHAHKDILHDDIETLIIENVADSKVRYCYTHTTSDRPNSYARLHEVSYLQNYSNGSHEEFKIAILVGFNGVNACGTEEEQRRFVLEFNPQKFVCPRWLGRYFRDKEYVVEFIDGIDVAFDFRGFQKRNFRYVLNNGNTVSTSTGTAMNKTDYIGKERKNNGVKIYDKKKERAPYYELDEETTRVEITLSFCYKFAEKTVGGEDMKHILAACDVISQIFVVGQNTDDALLYALTCLDQDQLNNALSRMTAPTKRKYKRLLKETAEYRLMCDPTELVFFLRDTLPMILCNNYIPMEKSWLSFRKGDNYAALVTENVLYED